MYAGRHSSGYSGPAPHDASPCLAGARRIAESGDVQHWTGAVTAPNKLARAGWTKSTLKPGDEVEITGRPGRNGAHAMHIMRIVMADRHALQMREQLDGITLP